eukprot:14270909-Heterocapsa_arctica.AAC.1
MLRTRPAASWWGMTPASFLRSLLLGGNGSSICAGGVSQRACSWLARQGDGEPSWPSCSVTRVLGCWLPSGGTPAFSGKCHGTNHGTCGGSTGGTLLQS